MITFDQTVDHDDGTATVYRHRKQEDGKIEKTVIIEYGRWVPLFSPTTMALLQQSRQENPAPQLES